MPSDAATNPTPSILFAVEAIAGLSATQASAITSAVMESAFPATHCTVAPYDLNALGAAMVDAGEAQVVTLPTVTADGQLTEASYTLIAGGTQAIIDCAPLCASQGGDTYGVGVLVADAISRGVHIIALLVDGVATCDAGTGLLTALGAQFHDAAHTTVAPGALDEIASVDTAQFDVKALGVEFVLVTRDGRRNSPAKPCCTQVCDVLGVDPSIAGLAVGGGIGIALEWMRPGTSPLPAARFIASMLGHDRPGSGSGSGTDSEDDVADVIVAITDAVTATTVNDVATVAGAFSSTGRPVAFIGTEVELPEAIPHAVIPCGDYADASEAASALQDALVQLMPRLGAR
ncbi:glycerate kinase [Corynebacterium argentoratense]|uniref:glycerate kinase n=1 Tax=Corynebacterium argentoratense TaxID=42817 RepID=UPI001F339F91|nr:glycerate kinase [Corynebacterium argentoratense]MCF1764935.1 glycerate kinase [Corynebacterium argentoratense]